VVNRSGIATMGIWIDITAGHVRQRLLTRTLPIEHSALCYNQHRVSPRTARNSRGDEQRDLGALAAKEYSILPAAPRISRWAVFI
jgi:hypothetical protein